MHQAVLSLFYSKYFFINPCQLIPNLNFIFFICKAFGNSRMLTDLKKAGKKPVRNASTKSGPGRGCSWMLGMGNFPDFLVKIWYPGNGIWEPRPLKHVHSVLFCNIKIWWHYMSAFTNKWQTSSYITFGIWPKDSIQTKNSKKLHPKNKKLLPMKNTKRLIFKININKCQIWILLRSS